jgi:hypothetical protein
MRVAYFNDTTFDQITLKVPLFCYFWRTESLKSIGEVHGAIKICFEKRVEGLVVVDIFDGHGQNETRQLATNRP